MKYYTDGSSTIGVKSAYVVTNDSGGVVDGREVRMDTDHKVYTNNEEEYHGVIAALDLAVDGDEILSDSLLVVNQIKGIYKAKQPHLKALCDQAQSILKNKSVTLTWISRDGNLAGKIFEKH